MKLYEILIPERRNNGGPYANEHKHLQRWLMHNIGSFSKCPMIAGAWRNADGTEYYENMVPYRVYCLEERFTEILAEVILTFDDQMAFMFCDFGDAKIVHRAEVMS